MYARVMTIRFPPTMRAEVIDTARGLPPILQQQQGYKGLNVLTEAVAGEGLIISYWQTEADAKASEASPSYIGQMSMMARFLYGRLIPRSYEVNVRA